MEMAYDSVDPEECKAWIVDDIYFDPEFRDDTGALLSRTAAPDILDVTADLASDMLFSEFDLNMVSHRHVNESGLDQLPWAPWGLINNNQHFDWTPDPTSTTTTSLTNFDRTPDPTSMTTTSLTSSRSDSIWSPSSGNLTFTSPLVSMDTPSLTPDFFALQSPQNHTDSFSGDPIITSESVTGNTDGITDYIADYTVAASAMLGIEELPTQVAAAPRLLTIGDCPPGVPMRQWRNKIKPESCPVCLKPYAYRSGDWEKHIRARHPQVAHLHGVSTEKPKCQWCPKSFSTQYNLLRHLRNKHGG